MKTLALAILMLASASALALTDIPNFSKVNESIYRGGRPTDDGLMSLKNLGIKTNINLQGGDIDWSDPSVVEFMKWWEPGETPENIAHEHELTDYLQIGFVAAPLNSIAQVTPEEDSEIDLVLEIMHDPAAQPVFVHCEHGRDRTGLIVALYRVKFEGLDVEDAHDEWVDMGHSGVGAYFTGNLDKYYYEKVKAFTAPKLLEAAAARTSVGLKVLATK